MARRLLDDFDEEARGESLPLWRWQSEKPPETVLRKTKWTKDKLESASWIKEKDGKYFVGDRQIILDDDEAGKIIRREYRDVPSAIGYLRFYSYLLTKYLGIRRKLVQDFLANQERRQVYRRLNKPSATQAIVTKAPGVRWTWDHGKLDETTWKGKKYTHVLVGIDNFSKYVYLFGTNGDGAEETIRCFTLWLEDLEEMGDEFLERVKIVATDNGPGFKSAQLAEWFEQAGIRHIRSRAYNPTSQAHAERLVQTVKGYLISFTESKFDSRKRWPELIDRVQELLRTTWQRVLKRTPEEVFKGQAKEETRERIKSEAEKRRFANVYDKSVLEPGQAVRVSLRITGSSALKDAYKQGRVKGYEQQWDERNTYTVKRRYGRTKYELNELPGERIDRTDLLKIPSKTPEQYPSDPDASPTRGRRNPRARHRRAAPAPMEARQTRARSGVSRPRREDEDFVRFEDDL